LLLRTQCWLGWYSSGPPTILETLKEAKKVNSTYCCNDKKTKITTTVYALMSLMRATLETNCSNGLNGCRGSTGIGNHKNGLHPKDSYRPCRWIRSQSASTLHLSPAYKSRIGIATQVGFSCFLVPRCGALRTISSYRKCIHHVRNVESTQVDTRGKYVRGTDTG
jgi:hypothetical protein